MERQTMIEQGVKKGLYKLDDVVMGEESVGDKKFYTMKYATSDSRVHQSATLYLFFPKEEKNTYFIVIHYSETIPRGVAIVLPFHRDFLEILKSLRIESSPKEFSNAWYRPGDRGFSLKAYSASGKLIVREERIVFGEGRDTLEIPFAEVKSVSLGRMAGDTANDWVILRYGSPEKAAGFKDGSRLGWGQETTSIHSTVTSAFESWSARQRR